MTTAARTSILLVLAAAALWGTTGTAQTFASGDLPAAWFGALRLTVAAMFFTGYAHWKSRRHGEASRGWPVGWPVLGAGLCMAVYNLAFFAGIRDTGVAVGTAVALGSGPVWAGLLQAALTRHVPGPRWWLGTGLAIAGGALLCGLAGARAVHVSTLGIVLCLTAGLAYAGYTLLSKRLAGSAPAAVVTRGAFVVAALVAVACAWWHAGWPRMQTTDVAAVAYVGLVTAGVAYLLFNQALRHISAATGVTLALGEPVVAFVLATTLIGEPASLGAVLGLVLVVAGVLVVVRAELTSPRGVTPVPAGA